MSTREVHHSLRQFEHALERLKAAIDATGAADELQQDGVIQRFEFTFELMWKTLKRYLMFLGQRTNNPRDTLKAAFREKLLPAEEPFLTMLDDRNLSAHVYDFETSRRIFQHIAQQYSTAMHAVAVQLRERLGDHSG